MRYRINLTEKQLGHILYALNEVYKESQRSDNPDELFSDLSDILVDQAEDQELQEKYPDAIIRRAWAMPSKHTFKIKPIRSLLDEYIDEKNKLWIDPFAGFNSPVTNTNDLNPKAPTLCHMQALDFIKRYDRIKGIIFDPPYSPRQISECYKSAGLNVTQETTQNAKLYSEVKNEATKRMMSGSIAISCGWNSGGFGKERGFQMIEILIVSHGAAHNDTIVVVELKK
jgi:hypothetical protein